jgi:hypothetical protein
MQALSASGTAGARSRANTGSPADHRFCIIENRILDNRLKKAGIASTKRHFVYQNRLFEITIGATV